MGVLISIIVPVYNSDKFLSKCLDSIVNQSYDNLEVIVVNDGSTDCSREILHKYAELDKRIKLFDKDNGGIGSAYNVAFKHITGDYVLFVDSDDFLELDACKSLVVSAVEHDADLVHFKRKVITEDGIEVKEHSHFNFKGVAKSNDEVIDIFLTRLKHPSLINLYKASLFSNVKLFNQNIGIDEMLTPQLLMKIKKAVYLNNTYYNVVYSENSVSRIVRGEIQKKQISKVYRFIIDYLKEEKGKLFNHYLEKYYRYILGELRNISFVEINSNYIDNLIEDSFFIKNEIKNSKMSKMNLRWLKFNIYLIGLIFIKWLIR